MPVSPDNVSTLIVQHWDQYRHHDNLKWSRIQTAAIVEGGLLVGLLQQWPGFAEIDGQLVLVAAGSLIVMISLLAIKDEIDGNTHESEAISLEKSWGYQFPKTRYPITGTAILYSLIAGINGLNLWLLCRLL